MQIRSSFDPGGTETSLVNLFNYNQGDFQIFLVLLKDGFLINELVSNNHNVLIRLFRKRFIDFGVIYKLYKLQKKERIQIIHVHQFIELFYALCLKILNPQIRIIHHIHTMFSEKNLVFYLERFFSQKFCDKIITVSKTARSELSHAFGYQLDKIEAIYNGVKIQEKKGIDLSEINRLIKVPIDEKRINVVMLANFVWGKDHETLFKAYDLYIRDQLPELSIYFIGRKTEITERLAESYLLNQDIETGRIVLCGSIPDARSFLKVFDIFIMSSYSETFNQAVIEAATLGNTILVSDIPVFKELSNHEKYFTFFKTGDPLDLFEQLKALVKSNEHARAEQSKYYKEEFSYDRFVLNLKDLYESSGNGQE